MTKNSNDSPVSTPAKKRKRGGQPNNKNAYKHGFYSEHFSAFENRLLSEIPLSDVTDVIDLMRVNMGRFMEAYTASLEELNYEDRHAAFRSLSLGAGCIASLVRIQISASRNTSEAEQLNRQLMQIEEGLMSRKNRNNIRSHSFLKNEYPL